MFFANIFDTKVVDNEGEQDGASLVFPKAGSVGDGCVTEGGTELNTLQLGVGGWGAEAPLN